MTKRSKLETMWTGVSVDTLLGSVSAEAGHVTASCDGDYTTNLPLEDPKDGKARVAYEHEDEPLEPEHGGPARLLMPHRHPWKSAKWVRGLNLTLDDEAGFWESFGYHNTATRGASRATGATDGGGTTGYGRGPNFRPPMPCLRPFSDL